MKHFTIIALFAFFLSGCASESPDTSGIVPIQAQLPKSFGRPNQLLVISDSTLWTGAAGDTFFYYFAAPYILLPQPEPIFDIQHMTPEQLAKMPGKKEFKTIFFLADMTDKNSPTTLQVNHDVGAVKVEEARTGKGYTTIVGSNKWARNQQLFYVFGFGEEKLAENIGKNFAPIARRINDRDEKMVEANAFQSGNNTALQDEIRASFGVEMKIPGSFKKILYNSNTNSVWLRSDDRDVVANILIHRQKYTNENQLTYNGIKKIINEVGKMITSQLPDTYMEVNDVDLPLFVEKKTLHNFYTVQAKGIWEITNDFKGGAFISNLMLDQEKNELVLVDGFLFAPGVDKKRNYMQEIEMIISSAVPLSGEK